MGRTSYGRLPAQLGELRRPAGQGLHPVVILIHGGFWRAEYDLSIMDFLADALLEHGLATWNIEYRRVGEEGGGWPGTFEDVGAAVDHLRALASTHALDLERVVTLGHSAGGHLALWAAGRHRIDDARFARKPLALRGAVALAAVPDLRRASALGFSAVDQLMGGPPAAVSDRYAIGSPADLLPLGVRQVLVHGSDDNLVPFSLSDEYHAAAVAKGDDARLVPLAGLGHFEPIDPTSSAWPAVRDAVLGLVR